MSRSSRPTNSGEVIVPSNACQARVPAVKIARAKGADCPGGRRIVQWLDTDESGLAGAARPADGKDVRCNRRLRRTARGRRDRVSLLGEVEVAADLHEPDGADREGAGPVADRAAEPGAAVELEGIGGGAAPTRFSTPANDAPAPAAGL